MFGFSIVRTERIKRLQYLEVKEQKFWNVHRWFAGWRDLDIIWTYLVDDVNFGGIETARKDYAIARGTDEYGKPSDKSPGDKCLPCPPHDWSKHSGLCSKCGKKAWML